RTDGTTQRKRLGGWGEIADKGRSNNAQGATPSEIESFGKPAEFSQMYCKRNRLLPKTSVVLGSMPGRHSPYVAAVPGSAAVAGSVMVNTAPPPGAEDTSMLPPCSRSTVLQMLSPRPVPRPGRLVVKKGSKMCARFSGAIPGPSS